MVRFVQTAHEIARLALVLAALWALAVWVPAGAGLVYNASRLVWSAAALVETLNGEAKANAGDVRATVHSVRVIAARTEDTAAEVHGITASVNQMAWKAAQPETRGQKVIAGLKIGALVLSKFVPF